MRVGLALRLLDGDERLAEMVRSGELGALHAGLGAVQGELAMSEQMMTADDILKTAEALRWQIGQNFHEELMEDIYTGRGTYC